MYKWMSQKLLISKSVLWHEDKNDNVIIYEIESEQYYKIENSIGKDIFMLILKGNTYANIYHILVGSYPDTAPIRIKKDIVRFISYLQLENIVSIGYK